MPASRRWADPLRPLAGPDLFKRDPQLGAIGQAEIGIELEQREEHESPRAELRVRKGEAVGAQLDLAEEQQVDVDRPGPVARTAEGAAVLSLDRLADAEQLLRLERSPDPDHRVQEVRLIENLAHRLGLVQRGDRLDINPVPAQVLDRPPQVGFAIADVRAEAKVAGPPALAQTPSSSSGSRSMDRSRVTSTPASCTG